VWDADVEINGALSVDVKIDWVCRSSGSPEDIQDEALSGKSHFCAFRKLISNLAHSQQQTVQLLLRKTSCKAVSSYKVEAFHCQLKLWNTDVKTNRACCDDIHIRRTYESPGLLEDIPEEAAQVPCALSGKTTTTSEEHNSPL